MGTEIPLVPSEIPSSLVEMSVAFPSISPEAVELIRTELGSSSVGSYELAKKVFFDMAQGNVTLLNHINQTVTDRYLNQSYHYGLIIGAAVCLKAYDTEIRGDLIGKVGKKNKKFFSNVGNLIAMALKDRYGEASLSQIAIREIFTKGPPDGHLAELSQLLNIQSFRIEDQLLTVRQEDIHIGGIAAHYALLEMWPELQDRDFAQS